MNIVNYLYNHTKKYFNVILILALGILFYFVASYAYSTANISEKFTTSDVANSQEFVPGMQVYFFFADWCPHCKTAKPEWDRFKRKYDGKKVNGNLVECIDVNCTDDSGENTVTKTSNGIKTSSTTIDLIRKYNINGYPTIKFVKDDKVYDYEAKVNESNLSDFIETTV